MMDERMKAEYILWIVFMHFAHVIQGCKTGVAWLQLWIESHSGVMLYMMEGTNIFFYIVKFAPKELQAETSIHNPV